MTRYSRAKRRDGRRLYPRLCQEVAGQLRTLYNPADYPPAAKVRSRFTFRWQYVSYGMPEQLWSSKSRGQAMTTTRSKAV